MAIFSLIFPQSRRKINRGPEKKNLHTSYFFPLIFYPNQMVESLNFLSLFHILSFSQQQPKGYLLISFSLQKKMEKMFQNLRKYSITWLI